MGVRTRSVLAVEAVLLPLYLTVIVARVARPIVPYFQF